MSKTFLSCVNNKSSSAVSSRSGSPLLERRFLGRGADNPAAIDPAVDDPNLCLRLLFSCCFRGRGVDYPAVIGPAVVSPATDSPSGCLRLFFFFAID